MVLKDMENTDTTFTLDELASQAKNKNQIQLPFTSDNIGNFKKIH